jgi:DNA polymerase III subunit alpha
MKLRKHKCYIPLHGHSSYSFGDSPARIEDIISRAKEINSDAVGISEHGNMSSFLKFYHAANDAKLKPILGCELYINDKYFESPEEFKANRKSKSKRKTANSTLSLELSDNLDDTDDETDTSEDEYGSSEFKNNHLIAYAKNYDGLKNLIHLTNNGFVNFYRKPLINTELVFNILDKNNIVTTGCLASQFNSMILNGSKRDALKLIKKYKEKFNDDFYLEVQLNDLSMQKQVNMFYEVVSKELDIKPILGLDYHYAKKDDWYLQYLLYVIKSRKTINSLPENEWFYNVRDLYIKNIDEVYDYAEKIGMNIKFLEKAIDSTFEVRDKTDIVIPEYPDNYPKFTSTKSESSKLFREKLTSKFDEKIKNGLIPNDKIDEYKERLNYELSIIEQKGVIDYFLVLDDLLNNFVYAVGGATGSGRGSAASSLVLFVMDITKIDPIKYELIFSRFLNEARRDPPDVDLDIDSITQKDVEDYLKTKWGYDKVCHIANFGKFGSKTIIKDLCRVFELDYNLSNQLTSVFDTKKSDSPLDIELAAARKLAATHRNDKLVKFIDDNYDLFVGIGGRMLGAIRNCGRHASGILISNNKLINSDIPIMKLKGDYVTAVQEGGDEREVTDLGYLKLDILGLITATINSHTFKEIEKRYGIHDLEKQLLLSEFDDSAVYEEFQLGNSKDIFQFGSDSMISLIQRIKPNCIEDLCAINSLFRPALIEAKQIDVFIKNRKNPSAAKKKLDKLSPKLWPILESAHGIPLYQEHVMIILQKLGGFTTAEADTGRKILKLLHKGNQEKSDEFIKMMNKFKKNAIKNGMTKEAVEELLNILASYTEYSFNLCLSSDTKVITKNGSKQICDVKAGETVLSYDYYNDTVYEASVKENHRNGKKNIYEFETETGSTVKCTMDHKFLCEDGVMRPLKEIIEKNIKIIEII